MEGALKFGRIILPPIAHRLGTGAAVWLVAQGIPDDLVQRTIVAGGVVAGIALDMATHFLSRRSSR